MIPVMFRYDDVEKEVIILFPTLSANDSGSEMISYNDRLDKIPRNIDWFKRTRPALKQEYCSLKNKIQKYIGYNTPLSIRKSLIPNMHTQRINHAKGR